MGIRLVYVEAANHVAVADGERDVERVIVPKQPGFALHWAARVWLARIYVDELPGLRGCSPGGLSDDSVEFDARSAWHARHVE